LLNVLKERCRKHQDGNVAIRKGGFMNDSIRIYTNFSGGMVYYIFYC
jgi:hypothetical protein